MFSSHYSDDFLAENSLLNQSQNRIVRFKKYCNGHDMSEINIDVQLIKSGKLSTGGLLQKVDSYPSLTSICPINGGNHVS